MLSKAHFHCGGIIKLIGSSNSLTPNALPHTVVNFFQIVYQQLNRGEMAQMAEKGLHNQVVPGLNPAVYGSFEIVFSSKRNPS